MSANGLVSRAGWKGRPDLIALLVLLVCLLAVHGHGLWVGFWFDDHNHLELCRQNGFGGVAQSNSFDWTTRLAHIWWARQEVTWAYFRPLTVAIRLALLSLFGLSPVPFHVLHLLLFTLSVALFYGLLRRCGWRASPALATCVLFVLHPTLPFSTTWLANDGVVLVGLWAVAALWLMLESIRAGHARPALLVPASQADAEGLRPHHGQRAR